MRYNPPFPANFQVVTGFVRYMKPWIGISLLFILLCAGAMFAQTGVPPAGASQPLPNERLPEGPVPQTASDAGAVLPPFKPVVPPPPTLHDRFQNWVHSSYQPGLLVPVLVNSYYSHVTASHDQFGSDAGGYGERLGASAALTEFHFFLQHFALATMFHQDSSFIPLRVGSGRQRAWYAVTRVAVARSDTGRPMFNYSEIGSEFLAVGLSNVFIPDERRGAGESLGRAATGLASDAGMNLLHEFWPSLSRLYQRHAPRKLQQVGQKVQATVAGRGK